MSFNLPCAALVKTLTLTALIAPLWAGTALAWTGDDVAKRLQNLLKQQMVELTYSKADVDGQTVTLRDAKVQLAAPEVTDTTDEALASLNLGDVTLANITETADGTYVVDKATIADTKIVEENIVFSTAGIRFEKLKLLENPKLDVLGRMEYLEGFHIGELSLSQNGRSFVSLNDFHLTNEPFTKEKPSNFSWGFKALDIDLEEIDHVSKENELNKAALTEDEDEATEVVRADPPEDAADEAVVEQATKRSDNNAVADEEEATTEPDTETTDETVADASDDFDMETIRALGLAKIHLTMATKGSWSPYSGQYTIDPLTLNGQNIGNFSYQLHMGGYDMKFIKAMQDFYFNIPKDGADNTAMQIAAMGLLQNLSISNMEMRYEDASFVNRLLDHEAKKKSVSREALVQEMKDQLQFCVDFFEGEQRVADAAKAIGEFLDKPKSISLKFQPEQPVSFGVLTAVGMAEPKKIWSILGVKVEANN